MNDAADFFLLKAEESLAGAESELTNGRYNNCANRCYYACFQAAIAALTQAAVIPGGTAGEWGHAFVQARFAGDLINRRKLYPAALRETLSRALFLRQIADYRSQWVTQTQAVRLVRSAREFVGTIQRQEGDNQ